MGSLSEKQIILFDWDGCLANTLGIWLDGYKQLTKGYDLNLSEEEIVLKFFGTGSSGPKEFNIDPKEFYDRLAPIIDRHLHKVTLNDYAFDLIQDLKNRGLKLAIVSTSSRSVLTESLKFNKLTSFFNLIISGDDVLNPKPHPEPILKAMEKLNADPVNTLMVGDSDKDILAAIAAGIDSVLYYPEQHRRFYSVDKQSSLGSTYIINSFRDLLDII